MSLSSKECQELEHKYSAHNYHPLPVVFHKAKGYHVWDPEGKKYIDCLSAYSAVNQGHCHPKIVGAIVDQASRVTLSSRAFINDRLGEACKKICETFKYESTLMMNSGAEAVETALKIARAWGYLKKGIPTDEAIIIACTGCFHGRTIAIISMSVDPDCRYAFGPFLRGIRMVEYGKPETLEAVLEECGDKVCAFLAEPIQGEAGVFVPPEGYLRAVRDLCTKHNVLYIDDEIQTGIARTGKMLAVDHEGVRPDMVCLGKAISGGTFPVSAVVCDRDIMDVIIPGVHGSTFGGCPMACAAAIASLEVIEEEGLCERAERLGQRMRDGLEAVKSPLIKLVRGKGLLNAVEIQAVPGLDDKTAWAVCLLMASKGVLAKPTHSTIIRLAPPLIIDEEGVDHVVKVFTEAVAEAPSYASRKEEIPFWGQ
eukprot:gnl/Dysnectes_brevis/2204_a2569_2073.p1 GENE.gnl/Dysnectes_brevis/2204_a2569_2073~~gnl/Dysnectes_brevis/2204_a2569_2073.p1  ORF type:complete len:441 (-),score=166.32 gnl/Dysnectes_brevis/2204_a2569_2073:86-1360(-)